MELIGLYWRSLVGLGAFFHAVFLGYSYAWAWYVQNGDDSMARTLAAQTALWGIIGTYVSLILSLKVDVSNGALTEFQRLLSLGPESSLIGLSLYMAMTLFQKWYSWR